jgi:hypothetical protein
MKKGKFITVITAILLFMVGVPAFSQEEYGYTKFNVREEHFTVMVFDVKDSKVLNYMGTKSGVPKNMYANFPAGIHSMYIDEVVNT